MYWSLIFFTISLLHEICAPPPLKRPRTELCVVQTPEFLGTKSSCDDGDLQKLAELANQEIPDGQSFGAKDLADLILARSGIFSEQPDLESIHICQKHKSDLGLEWLKNENNNPRMKDKGSRVPKCNMPPDLPSTPYAKPPTHGNRKSTRRLKKANSVTLWEKFYIFVPIGTGMCSDHHGYIEKLDQGAGGPQSPHTGDRSAGEMALRKNVKGTIVESPFERHSWTFTLRKSSQDIICPVASSPTVSTAGRSSIASSPDSQSHCPRTTESATNRRRKQIQKGIRQIATAIGVPATTVNFPRKQRFLELAGATQAKRVNVASHVTAAVMETFAPDAPHELFRRIVKKHAGDIWDHQEESSKFAELVEAVVDLYLNASSRQERLQTLSLVAPMMRYLHLQKFLPGLTLYAYKEARRYAKMARAGIPMLAPDQKKERYNRVKVESFIQFITSSMVVTDMPFGHVTVKLSSGAKLELPNLVRTTVNQRIIMMYKSYLTDRQETHLLLSDSSMWRILKACKAVTRKSLQGLDYYTYNGIEGIGDLIELAEKIMAVDGDIDWTKSIIRTLKDLKVFFKTDYKTHIQKESVFSDYSRHYALSDPKDKHLQAPHIGTPESKRRCAHCIAMMDAFRGFQHKIESVSWHHAQDKKEAEFVLDTAKDGILEWQKHIVRTVNQIDGKEDILHNLGQEDVWILMDWAMKWLPKKGTESQAEWWGKRGVSWHISVAMTRDPVTGEFAIRQFVHIFDPVKQNPETNIAIIEDVIRRIKSERPEIKNVYLRSDNAVCYHSGPTLAALNLIAEKTDVRIKRYDFSDPQSGKGACDRATSVIKRHVNVYVNQNKRCTTAEELLECAGSHPGVRATTFIHAGLKITESTKNGKGSIPSVTQYHNFEFEADGRVRAWNAYKIGDGKMLKIVKRTDALPTLDPIHGVSTAGQRHDGFLTAKSNWILLLPKKISANHRRQAVTVNDENWVPDESDDTEEVENTGDLDDPNHTEGLHRDRLFPCEVDGCIKVYQTYTNWFRHVNVGRHIFRKERFSLKDFSIKTYAEHIESSQIYSSIPAVSDALQSQHQQETVAADVEDLPIGWALKKRKPVKHFTKAQRDYLEEKFNEGATTGIKHDPHKVAQMMRQDPNFPTKDMWLTWSQIQSYFSRLAGSREKKGGAAPQPAAAQPTPIPATAVEDAETVTDESEENYLEIEDITDNPDVNSFQRDIEEQLNAAVDEAMDSEWE